MEEEYGYPFINFNLLYDELDIDFARDFYNGSHMNTNGAVKFTRYLAAFLSWILGVNMTRLVPSLREPHIFLPAY